MKKIGIATRLAYQLVFFCGMTFSEFSHSHAFGQRFDLPIPLNYYLTGAGGAVLFSFVVVAIFTKIPMQGFNTTSQVNLLQWRWAQFISQPQCISVVRFVACFVFLVTILAGILGPEDPAKNILPTMVWIIWWTGVAYFCALIGNLWLLINPWNSIYLLIESIYRRVKSTESELSLNAAYPQWLGYWPASMAFLVFVWGELVWTANAVPFNLAIAIITYSAITWLGMFVFGREVWLKRGEVFTLFFSLLARISLLGTDKKNRTTQWNLRPFGAGLLHGEPIPQAQVAFVILMLSTVTFDGFMGTPLWSNLMQQIPDWRPIQPVLFQLEMWGIYRETVLTSAGLLLFPVCFAIVYWFVAWSMKLIIPFNTVANDGGLKPMSTSEIAACFIATLLPIALAYHLAHYFSYLLIVGQFIIPLASDPFGMQWDLFGTRDYRINIAIVDARFVWNTSVLAIVAGHIIAVYVAHIVALRIFKNRVRALLSQIPMLVLMILYTMLSLWILAQPLIE